MLRGRNGVVAGTQQQQSTSGGMREAAAEPLLDSSLDNLDEFTRLRDVANPEFASVRAGASPPRPHESGAPYYRGCTGLVSVYWIGPAWNDSWSVKPRRLSRHFVAEASTPTGPSLPLTPPPKQAPLDWPT